MEKVVDFSQSDTFIKRTYKKYLVPSILAMLGGTINVLFDGILVGQKLGEDGLSAVSLAMPIYLVLCTIGAVVAGGGFVLSSREIGKEDSKKANEYYNTAFWILLLVCAVVTVGGLFMTAPISKMLATGGHLESLVHDYLFVTLLGSTAKIMIYLPTFYLPIMGKQKISSNALLVMTAVNIILDCLFLFVFNMGISGAALASVIASAIAVIIGFSQLLNKKSLFKIKLRVSVVAVREIFARGSAMGANNLASALRVLALNAILLKFGGSTYVSIFAVAIVVLSSQIGMLFGVEKLSLFFPMLCLAVSLFFSLANSVFSTHYSMIGRTVLSGTITFLRLLIVAVPILLALFGLHNSAVWLFLPLSEIATYIILVIVAKQIVKKHDEYDGIMLVDDSFEKSEHVLDFSVRPDAKDICDASSSITSFWFSRQLPQKMGMKISLAIEEIMMMYLLAPEGREKLESFDVRIFNEEGTIGVRIRCGGGLIDPFTVEDEEIDTFGIQIIQGVAEVAEYRNLLGFNNVLVLV